MCKYLNFFFVDSELISFKNKAHRNYINNTVFYFDIFSKKKRNTDYFAF